MFHCPMQYCSFCRLSSSSQVLVSRRLQPAQIMKNTRGYLLALISLKTSKSCGCMSGFLFHQELNILSHSRHVLITNVAAQQRAQASPNKEKEISTKQDRRCAYCMPRRWDCMHSPTSSRRKTHDPSIQVIFTHSLCKQILSPFCTLSNDEIASRNIGCHTGHLLS